MKLKKIVAITTILLACVTMAVAAFGTKARWENTYLIYYDLETWETIKAVSPMWYSADFIGPTLDSTNDWVAWDYKGGTETLKADQPNGVVELALTSAAESQTAGIDYANERPIRAAYGPSIEFRMRFTVILAESATAVWGLYGDQNAAVDTIAESIWFRANGSGVITVENDDTSNETSEVSTGVTVLVNVWHIYRIDMHDYTACRFYIDGKRVAAGTTFDMSTAAGLQLQPGAVLFAGQDIDLGTMEIDYVRMWGKRS